MEPIKEEERQSRISNQDARNQGTGWHYQNSPRKTAISTPTTIERCVVRKLKNYHAFYSLKENLLHYSEAKLIFALCKIWLAKTE